MFPEIRVRNTQAVVKDENHNAFTDLCRYRDSIYLTFRSCPDGHGIAPSSYIRVLKSEGAGKWREVCVFSVPDRDTRDPHFLVFNEQLFVYTGTWNATPDGIARRDLNEHVGYCVHSEDGAEWSDPVELTSTRGCYIWRAAAFDGKAYLCGRRRSGFASLPDEEAEWALQESAMLRSDNGLDWEQCGFFQETYGDETAFVFDEKGSVTAVSRCKRWTQPATVCRSEPPYEEWERTTLDRNIGGPMLARWGNFLLTGGRREVTEDDPTTVLYWLDEVSLAEAVVLESKGDNSYPGFVEIDTQHALVSYYSSHEGAGDPLFPAAIYVAELELE